MTCNTCNPPQIPREYGISFIPTCGKTIIWPEEFWNCADIAILPKGSRGVDRPDPFLPAFSPALSRAPALIDNIDDTATFINPGAYRPFPSVHSHDHTQDGGNDGGKNILF